MLLLSGTLSPPVHFVPIQGQPYSEDKATFVPPTALLATRPLHAHVDGVAPEAILAPVEEAVTSLLF